jgi:magnesium-protoporphyrin O-methyltransferase
MSCSCTQAGLADMFGERFARVEARRFRRRGIPRRSDRLIEAIRRHVPFHSATSLEGGAGVGGLSIELLRRGVSRAVAVDAIPAAVRMARRLAEEYGMASRFEAVVADFATYDSDATHEIVVLDRVVCCYPDWRGLLAAAARRSSRVVALTYPPVTWWSRVATSTVNSAMWVLRKQFRTYVHPPAEMHAMLVSLGFVPEIAERVGTWEICVARRAD